MTRRPAPFERRLSVESVRRPDDRRRTAYWNYFAKERVVGSLSLVGSRDWGGRVDGFRALGITHPENGRRHLERVELGTFAYRAHAEAAIWAFAESLAASSTDGES